MAMPRPPSPTQEDKLYNGITTYLKATFRKENNLDYRAKFKTEEFEKHLDVVVYFIKEALIKDKVYANKDDLNVALNATIPFIKAFHNADPDFLSKFAAGELKNSARIFRELLDKIQQIDPALLAQIGKDKFPFLVEAIAYYFINSSAHYFTRFILDKLEAKKEVKHVETEVSVKALNLIKVIGEKDPALLAEIAAGKIDFLMAAIAIYIKEITARNPLALPRLSEGTSKLFEGRFFYDLKVGGKELDSQALVMSILELDPFYIASIEKILAIYSGRHSTDSHLVKLFEMRANLLNRFNTQLTKTAAWSDIKFGEGSPETVVNTLVTCICQHILITVRDKLQPPALQEVTVILLRSKSLADVKAQHAASEKRKSVMLETVAGVDVKDFDKAMTDLKKTVNDAFSFQHLSLDDTFTLNENLKAKLSELIPLATSKSKSQEVVELILLIVKLVETKYDIINFKGKVLPSTHGLMTNIETIHNALCLKKNDDYEVFNDRVKRLKTEINFMMKMESNARIPSTSLLPPTPPVTKSVPLLVPPPAANLSMFASSQPQAQTLRDNKSKGKAKTDEAKSGIGSKKPK